MNIFPIKTEVFKTGDNLFLFFCQFAPKKIKEKSVIVISSKIIALSQNRVQKGNLEELVNQNLNKKITQKGGFILTEKDGIIIPNAGIDASNSPKGEYILWPSNPQNIADDFRKKLQKEYKIQNIGVVISDSRITPKRKGTTGVALAWSGIEGILDYKGKKDIYGNILQVSSVNIADHLASMGDLVMGQADEQTPFAIISDCPKSWFTEKQQNPQMAVMSEDEDLFEF